MKTIYNLAIALMFGVILTACVGTVNIGAGTKDEVADDKDIERSPEEMLRIATERRNLANSKFKIHLSAIQEREKNASLVSFDPSVVGFAEFEKKFKNHPNLTSIDSWADIRTIAHQQITPYIAGQARAVYLGRLNYHHQLNENRSNSGSNGVYSLTADFANKTIITTPQTGDCCDPYIRINGNFDTSGNITGTVTADNSDRGVIFGIIGQDRMFGSVLGDNFIGGFHAIRLEDPLAASYDSSLTPYPPRPEGINNGRL